MNLHQHRLRILLNGCLLTAITGLAACVSIKTEHKVEPIHITMDVNVRLERELEAAFSDLGFFTDFGQESSEVYFFSCCFGLDSRCQ
jgi:hypothetical protein